MEWLTPDLGPGVTAYVTTRTGGVSTGPYTSLDLAFHVGDDESAVSQNRDLLASALGLPVVYMNQVHGKRVAVVADVPPHGSRHLADADALVTSRPGVALAVMVADCLPILLADPRSGVVGAVHVGRRGLVEGVLPAVIRAMGRRGAGAEGIRAYVGPGICRRCYEVGPAVQAEVGAALPAAVATSDRGAPTVDLVAGALAQLAEAGVHHTQTSGLCTLEDDRFYSYRRAGRTGRFAGVVAMERRDTP